MLNYLNLLPFLFSIGPVLIKVLSGQASRQELNDVVDELVEMLQQIPVLSGFASLIILVGKVAKVVLENKDLLEVKTLLTNSGVTDDELKAAEQTIAIFDSLTDEATRRGLSDQNFVDKMTNAQILGQT